MSGRIRLNRATSDLDSKNSVNSQPQKIGFKKESDPKQTCIQSERSLKEGQGPSELPSGHERGFNVVFFFFYLRQTATVSLLHNGLRQTLDIYIFSYSFS